MGAQLYANNGNMSYMTQIPYNQVLLQQGATAHMPVGFSTMQGMQAV
jgi:hypothetical protein